LQRYRREADVLNHLTAIGCDVQLAYRAPRSFWKWFGNDVAFQASSLDLSNMPVGDVELAQVASLSGLEGLYVDGTNVTDQGVACLAGRTRLVALSLRNTAIRRPPPLAGMRKLLHLDLSNTAIEEFASADLLALEYLGLSGTQIGDASVAALGRLPNLQTLDLSRNTRITDRGAMELKRSHLPKLTRLYLSGTSVTEVGVAALSAEFPGAAVNPGRPGNPVGNRSPQTPVRAAATKGR
jgi:hypothetical protein